MPELPEVQTVVTTLLPRVLGRRICGLTLFRTDILTPVEFGWKTALVGRSVRAIDRRGKRIVFTLDDGNRFYIHLGMTGRLTAEQSTTPLVRHTHALFEFGEVQLRFCDPRRFGGIWWLGDAPDDEKEMGPEPLTIRARQFGDRLARTHRAIKAVLLDQRVIAGIGNIYADESLHAARIHPLTYADELTSQQIARLTQAIKRVLNRAIRHKGSTLRDYVDAEGRSGAFQHLHRVYNRAGQPCKTCKTPITRIVLAQRSTCFCPKCQKSTQNAER
jgi:formamidopyrimidine-DNA glycosylase